MFRFSQKLSRILDVSQVVQGQLDQYDIELEDAISNFTTSTSGGGDSLWEVVGNDLHPIANPITFTVDTTDSINLTPAGAFTAHSGGNTNIYADGDISVGAADLAVLVSDNGNADVNANGLGDVHIVNNGSGWVYVGTAAGHVRIYTNGTDPIQIFSGGDISLQIGSGANLYMLGLPTSAPATTGGVWRDPITNILKITP